MMLCHPSPNPSVLIKTNSNLDRLNICFSVAFCLPLICLIEKLLLVEYENGGEFVNRGTQRALCNNETRKAKIEIKKKIICCVREKKLFIKLRFIK